MPPELGVLLLVTAVVWSCALVLAVRVSLPAPIDLTPLREQVKGVRLHVEAIRDECAVEAGTQRLATKDLEEHVEGHWRSLAGQCALLAARLDTMQTSIDLTQDYVDAAHRAALEAVELATPAHVGDTHQHRLAKVATETRDGKTWDLYRCTDAACDERVFFSA